ncbi:MAG: chemotaxis protein CheW [Syntrophotaleaceae bacterium]
MAEVMEKASLSLDDEACETEDTQRDKFLTFFLADEDYGIAINHVIEIIGIQKITEVPDMPNFVKGVINLRGKVIPVMDVRARFHLPGQAYDERTCIIVVNVDTSRPA